MEKPKVLIVQETASNYNQATYEIIAQSVDLTVGYILKTQLVNPSFKTIQLQTKQISRFYLVKDLKRTLNNYDVVIIPPHFKFLNLAVLPLFKHKFKKIAWSIGIKASYTRPYDLESDPDLQGRLFGEFIKRCDAGLFYMKPPIDYWAKRINLDPTKCFVAHNTVAVCDFGELPDYSDRNSILFVGTLYKQKGIELLVNAYAKAKQKVNLPPLDIVGSGPEKEDVENLVRNLRLEKDVIFHGAIYDEKELMKLHLKANLSISPKQAGLSVLKSLGYGVPFITHKDAITGGERLNVIDNYNGRYFDRDEELTDILVDFANNKEKYATMASNAREYYVNKASVNVMAQGFLDAINYVLKTK